MRPLFETLLIESFRRQGFYANGATVPAPGGEMYCNINRHRVPDWRGWPQVDRMRRLAEQQGDPVDIALRSEEVFCEVKAAVLEFWGEWLARLGADYIGGIGVVEQLCAHSQMTSSEQARKVAGRAVSQLIDVPQGAYPLDYAERLNGKIINQRKQQEGWAHPPHPSRSSLFEQLLGQVVAHERIFNLASESSAYLARIAAEQTAETIKNQSKAQEATRFTQRVLSCYPGLIDPP